MAAGRNSKSRLGELFIALKVLVVMRYRKIFGGHEKFEISERFVHNRC